MPGIYQIINTIYSIFFKSSVTSRLDSLIPQTSLKILKAPLFHMNTRFFSFFLQGANVSRAMRMWLKAGEKNTMLFHLRDSKGLCNENLKVISYVHIKPAVAKISLFHNDTATSSTAC